MCCCAVVKTLAAMPRPGVLALPCVFLWLFLAAGGSENSLREDMLDILDLDAVPRPAVANRRLAAPRFMLDLYSAMNQQHHHHHVTSLDSAAFLARAEVAQAMAEADLVMSFPNHGR